MKSLIELRTFAVEKAAFLGGVGAPSAQVLAVAKEIEAYVLGGEQLPFTAESEPNLPLIAGVILLMKK